MNVRIVEFPETLVAVVEHRGSRAQEYESARKLIAWKIANGLLDPSKHRSYGIHYTNPRDTPDYDHRVDFCLSVADTVSPNPYGVITKVIPARRCAVARDVGSRSNNLAAAFLFDEWLPNSGEMIGDFPMFFHYVNVGPEVREKEMITDVHLPLT